MTSLLAYYKLDEASGSRIDPIGGYDLSDVNTVMSATGKQGDGADFERSNSEYLTRGGDDVALDLLGNFSIAGWVKLESTSTTLGYSQTLMSKDAGSSGWTLRTSGGDNKLNWIKDDASTYESTTALSSAGTWYFFCVTFDGTNIRVYVNGNTAESTTAYSSHANVANSFRMGVSSNYTTRYLDGILDEVGIWSKALTATEIGDLYNAGNGNTISQPTFVPKVITC